MTRLFESDVEQMAIEMFEALGYEYIHGPDLAYDGIRMERSNYEDVILIERLTEAIKRLNPNVPYVAQEDALNQVLRISSPDLVIANEEFHKMLTDGVTVEYLRDGEIVGDKVRLLDFTDPTADRLNEFLVVNQYTIEYNRIVKRPDILLFINGIPMVVIELKNPADENATVQKAYDQIQTYKSTIPSLFTYNALIVLSDGLDARAGTISADMSRFMPWKTKDGLVVASTKVNQLETLINGMLGKEVIIDLIQNFILFEKGKSEDPKTGIIRTETVKKLAGYHQYYAVNKAMVSVMKAATVDGDKRGGVVWHTQGSGKSLSMVFFSGKIIQRLDNPTIVVITDRNDLDDQLFGTFAASTQLLRQSPVQAENREHIKGLLRVASGGIIFTTIHKFSPEGEVDTVGNEPVDMVYAQLSDRRNIVVIADEAHRSQYGFAAKIQDIKDENREVIGQKMVYGFAKYMRDALPNATYIGFTGTPVEKEDANTPAVFGDYIDIYDIAQSISDHNTVPIYYESRLAKVNLEEEGRTLLEELDQEMSEFDEASESQKIKSKWARLEAIVGHPKRLKNLAKDIVTNWHERLSVIDGKAMIVAMSRVIAAELYEQIIALRPDWHSDDLNQGVIKVVMTSSSSDKEILQKHKTTKTDRKHLANRLKDEKDPLKLVIVRDMWLTGFDAPCLHTMYVDKPMKDHNLMQAIARVNRVFKDKPGGLIVDYIGISSSLKKALSFYSNAGGRGEPTKTHEMAVNFLMEKMEIIRQMYHRFNYMLYFHLPTNQKLNHILEAEEHILGLEDGKNRYLKEVTALGKAYSLCHSHEKAREVAFEIAFFQAVKARLAKFDIDKDTANENEQSNIDTTIKLIIDEAISSEEVVDIFDAAGIDKPDISVLSEAFLDDIQKMQHKNLAFELLKKLLSDEIKNKGKRNYVQSRTFMEMLETSLRKYQNNLITTAEVVSELVKMAKDFTAAKSRGEELGLTDDELAFYDALGTNDSAVQVLGDQVLGAIAKDLANKVRGSATIDWTKKESVRSRLMVMVRRTLKRWGYPPDKTEKAVETVMKQSELMADYWTA